MQAKQESEVLGFAITDLEKMRTEFPTYFNELFDIAKRRTPAIMMVRLKAMKQAARWKKQHVEEDKSFDGVTPELEEATFADAIKALRSNLQHHHNRIDICDSSFSEFFSSSDDDREGMDFNEPVQNIKQQSRAAKNLR